MKLKCLELVHVLVVDFKQRLLNTQKRGKKQGNQDKI